MPAGSLIWSNERKMCEAEAGYARQYLARHTKSWQVPGMHIAAVKGSRGARLDRL